MSKRKRIPLIIALALVAVIALVLLGGRLYFRLPVQSYYKASEKAFVIPGLWDGFVPQGIEYVPSENTFLVTGYQNNGDPTRIYMVDAQTGSETGFVTLSDSDGQPVSLHAGGLAVHSGLVYICGNEEPYLYVYRLSDLFAVGDGGSVNMIGKVSTDFGGDGIRADFVCAGEDRLIVGEFYYEPKYPTPASHKFVTPSGETYDALALCYHYTDDSDNFGLETQPFEAYSLPGIAQGLTIHDGKIWLSMSFRVAFSTVNAYDMESIKPFAELPTTEGSIPLSALDESSMTASLKLPPMSEEIVFFDGKLLVMCESATQKYYFGLLTGGKWCYATDVEYLMRLTDK